MLATIEARAPLLRKIGQRCFDDLIGRELTHLTELLGLAMEIGERNYFEPVAQGGWHVGS